MGSVLNIEIACMKKERMTTVLTLFVVDVTSEYYWVRGSAAKEKGCYGYD